MNTIYDGSFVLGQTSATNFIAGPGITIDSPSAGTVRIGTDETVLWSGDAYTGSTAFTLTEPITSFNKVEIWNKGGQIYEIGSTWSAADTPNTCVARFNRYDSPVSGCKIVDVGLSANPNNYKDIVYKYNKICVPQRFSTTANNYGITYYQQVGDGETHIVKVVGINRKEV